MVQIVRQCLLSLALMLLVPGAAHALSRIDFGRLDSLIAAQPQLIAAKEARLAQMKADMAGVTSLGARYQAMKRLYEEYSAYQYDSAYACVSECLHLAQLMDDPALQDEARLNLAHILSTACLMEQARQTLDRIDVSRLTPSQRIQ